MFLINFLYIDIDVKKTDGQNRSVIRIGKTIVPYGVLVECNCKLYVYKFCQ